MISSLRVLAALIGVALLVVGFVAESGFYGRWLFGLEADHGWLVRVLSVPTWLSLGTILLLAAPVRAPGRRECLVGFCLALPATIYLTGLGLDGHAVGTSLIGGCWIVCGGLLLGSPPFLAARAGVGTRVSGPLLLAGFLLLTFHVVFEGYQAGIAREPRLPEWLQHVVLAAARLAGIHAAVDAGELVMFSMRAKWPVPLSWPMLFDPPGVLFAVGVLGLAITAARPWRTAAFWLLGFSLLQLLELILALAIYLHRVLRTDYDAEIRHATWFWSEFWHLGMLAPAVLLGLSLLRLPRSNPESQMPNEGAVEGDWALRLGVAAMAVATGLALGLACLHHPNGSRKAGRVLFDEWHSALDDWMRDRWIHKKFDTTSTLRPYDTQWYGEAAAYNYATLYERMSRYYDVRRQARAIDDQALAAVDVLVLKVPTRSFEPSEVSAVVRFVERGGGLLLIGEHTSVFGSGVCLNQIARKFGFEFRYDCLFGMDEVYKQHYRPPLAPHPAIQRMGDLDFAVSCSIDPFAPVSAAGTAVIRGGGLRSLDANYFAPNSYPAPAEQSEMLHSSFVQVWATEHRNGRVMAFTDSTIFANFAIHEPGKWELALGMVEWLNHRPGRNARLALGLGSLLVVGLVVLLLLRRVSVMQIGAGLLLGFAISVLIANSAHARGMPAPTPKPGHQTVEFAIERSLSPTVDLSLGGFVNGLADGFSIFERSIQRLTHPHRPGHPGATWVSSRRHIEQSLSPEVAVVVCIQPTEPVAEDVQGKLVRYVADGGKLLVMESSRNERSTAQALLTPFGLSLGQAVPAQVGGNLSPGLLGELPVMDARSVAGGTPLATLRAETGGDQTVAVYKKHGRGLVVLLGCASRFSDFNMGVSTNIEPDAILRSVYEAEYRLLRAIVDDKLPRAQ